MKGTSWRIRRWTLAAAVFAMMASGFLVGGGAAGASARPVPTAVPETTAVGTIYLTDRGNDTAYKVSPNGTVTSIGTGLSQPHGLTLDKHGDVFIADTYNGRIVEEPAGGGAQITAADASMPFDVAVDARGDLFVVSNSANDAFEIPAGGGAQIMLATDLANPEGIAVDPSGLHVYIADTYHGRVVEVPMGGGTETTVASGVGTPTGLAVDAAGDLFIASYVNGVIYEAPAGGGSVKTVWSGSESEQVFDVKLDASGDLFFSDNERTVLEIPAGGGTVKTVYRSTSNATILFGAAVYAPAPKFTADHAPGGFTGASYQYQYKAAASSAEPHPTFQVASGSLPPGLNLDSSTGLLSGVPSTGGIYTFDVEASNDANGLVAPQSIRIVAGPGEVFVTEPGYNLVQELPEGTIIGSDHSNPTGVAVDGSGDVFIDEQANNGPIVEEPVAGGPQVTVAPGVGASDLAVDSYGNLFAVVAGGNSLLEIPAGQSSPTRLADDFYGPEGVAVDPEGDVFVADTLDNRVVEVPAGGAPQKVIGGGFSKPAGVAVDTAGDIFVADSGNSRVVELPRSGAMKVLGSSLYDPTGVAVDASGNVFVAENGSGSVLEYPAGGGSPTTLASNLDGAVNVAVTAPPPAITVDKPPAGASGTSYSYRFKARSVPGEPAPMFRVVAGSLPPGLTLARGGLLAGTPTTTGTYSFTVAAENAAMASDSPPLSLTIS